MIRSRFLFLSLLQPPIRSPELLLQIVVSRRAEGRTNGRMDDDDEETVVLYLPTNWIRNWRSLLSLSLFPSSSILLLLSSRAFLHSSESIVCFRKEMIFRSSSLSFYLTSPLYRFSRRWRQCVVLCFLFNITRLPQNYGILSNRRDLKASERDRHPVLRDEEYQIATSSRAKTQLSAKLRNFSRLTRPENGREVDLLPGHRAVSIRDNFTCGNFSLPAKL